MMIMQRRALTVEGKLGRQARLCRRMLAVPKAVKLRVIFRAWVTSPTESIGPNSGRAVAATLAAPNQLA